VTLFLREPPPVALTRAYLPRKRER
jgi:hypothetical protein